MDIFSLVLVPTTAAAASLVQIFIFVFIVAIVPGSLLGTLLSYVGFRNNVFRPKLAALKLVEFILYHAAMLGMWFYTWPQIYNPIHSGYALSAVPTFSLYMALWTIFSVLIIFFWKQALDENVFRPTIGMYFRLFIWNFIVMTIFRQIIYAYIT